MWVLMENPLETRMDSSGSNDTASATTAYQAVFLRVIQSVPTLTSL